MTHDTADVRARTVDTGPVSDSKNSIVVSRDVAERLRLVEGMQVTVINREPSTRRRGTGRYLGAFEIAAIETDCSGDLLLGADGREYVSNDESFPATVRNQVPDNTLGVEAARRRNEFTETAHVESYRSSVLALAYHGGDIEANTDESAWWFHKKCKEHGVDADVYTARGFGKDNFGRWHVGSSSMHLRSFPLLRDVASRQYDLVVSFHLHDVTDPDRPKVLVGGRVSDGLRERTATRLDDALPAKYEYVTDRDAHSMMGGSHRNLVNWLSRSGEDGLQIEVTPRISQTKRKTVGREVALAVLERADETTSRIEPNP